MSLYRTCNIIKIAQLTSSEVISKINRSKAILASKEKVYDLRRKNLYEKCGEYIPHTEFLYNNYIVWGVGLEYIIKIKMRFDKLLILLVKKGISFRTDSKLCRDYILSGKKNIDKIVNKMVEMNWLYNNTNYPKIMSGLIFNINNSSYPHPISKIARMRVYKSFNGEYPIEKYILNKIKKYNKQKR